MNPLTEAKLRDELHGDEGIRLKVYDDATGQPIGPGSVVKGNPSIGCGRNLSGRGITLKESDELLADDMLCCESELSHLTWITTLTPGRQTVIYSLYFNTGLGNPARFEAKWPKLLQQMQTGEWEAAASNLETSQPWGTEVGPGRVHRLAELVRYG